MAPSYCDCSQTLSFTFPSRTIRDPGSRSELTVVNEDREQFCLYRVDRGILPEETGRRSCDYLLVVPAHRQAYLIELKGKKFEDGYDQLEDSFIRLRDSLQPCKHIYGVLVSTTRLPRESEPYKRLLRKFKSMGCELLYLPTHKLSIPQPTPC